MTIAAYAPTWLRAVEGNVRPSTAAFYRTLVEVHLVHELGSYRVTRVSPPVVRALIAKMRGEGYASRTIRGVLDVMRQVLRQAMADGIVDRNVVDLIQRPRLEQKEPRHLTSEEARSFLAAADGDAYRSLFAVALFTGLRRGELLGLTWRDVDLATGTIAVRRETTKTDAGVRRIPLALDALEALRAMERRPGRIWLISPTAATRKASAIAKKAGLEGVGMHTMRHSTASLLHEAGVDDFTIQAVLGHTKVRMTGRYVHVSEAAMREALEKAARLVG